MDSRGWVTEFRCMEMNIALRKKLERDLGLKSSDEGLHIRRNLKEIVLFECLIEESCWLSNPREAREKVVTLDGKEELSENMTEFWNVCGQNRDLGTQQLCKHEVVVFRDVTVMKKDSDELVQSAKDLIKQLPELIKKISDENSMKGFLSEHFKTEIRRNKKLSVISNFYENVQEILKDQERDTDSDEDDTNDLSVSEHDGTDTLDDDEEMMQ